MKCRSNSSCHTAGHELHYHFIFYNKILHVLHFHFLADCQNLLYRLLAVLHNSFHILSVTLILAKVKTFFVLDGVGKCLYPFQVFIAVRMSTGESCPLRWPLSTDLAVYLDQSDLLQCVSCMLHHALCYSNSCKRKPSWDFTGKYTNI